MVVPLTAMCNRLVHMLGYMHVMALAAPALVCVHVHLPINCSTHVRPHVLHYMYMCSDMRYRSTFDAVKPFLLFVDISSLALYL